MEGYLRKYGWAIQLGFVIIVASLLAFIASGVVAVYLAPFRVPVVDLSYDTSRVEAANVVTKVSPSEMARVIESRCLFNGCPKTNDAQTCTPPCTDGKVCSNGACIDDPNAQPTQTADANGLPIESTAGIRILGIVVASNPRYSTVILSVPGAPVSVIAGIGDTVAGGEIKEIYRDRIILEVNGHLEYVRLDNSLQGNPSNTPTFGSNNKARRVPNRFMEFRPPSPTPPPPPVVAAAAAAAAVAAPPIDPQAPRVFDSNQIAIDRREFQRSFSNPMALVKEANIVPHFDNGRPAGITVSRVPPSLARFGVRSGDVVKKINGKVITTQMSAFEALNNLKTANSLEIEVERNGRNESLHYHLK